LDVNAGTLARLALGMWVFTFDREGCLPYYMDPMAGRFSFCKSMVLWFAMLIACAILRPASAAEPVGTATGERQVQVPDSAAQTNSYRINRLQRLEDDLSRALKNMFGRDSIEMPARRPPPPVLVVPRGKDRDERNDWLLPEPEDFRDREFRNRDREAPDMADFLNPQDRRERPASPRDQFLRDFLNPEGANRPTAQRSSEAPILGEARSWLKSERDDQTPVEILRSEENLRNLLRDESIGSISSLSRKGPTIQLFPTPESRDVISFKPVENTYLEEYRKMMASPAAQTGNDLQPGNDLVSSILGSVGSTPTQTRAPASLEPITTGRRDRELVNPQFGNINPVLTPRELPNQTTTVLNQWNPFYKPPDLETPRTYTPPPKPVFEAPRRQF
jgi:hypothetical protein